MSNFSISFCPKQILLTLNNLSCIIIAFLSVFLPLVVSDKLINDSRETPCGRNISLLPVCKDDTTTIFSSSVQRRELMNYGQNRASDKLNVTWHFSRRTITFIKVDKNSNVYFETRRRFYGVIRYV